MEAKFYYVHDPMCSWCWGYNPTWKRLKDQLPTSVKLEYLVGGLAPDSDVDMPMEMQQGLQRTWQQISAQLGTHFNFDFWTKNKPRRSTYPACRAVIAADIMNGAGGAMVDEIQKAYYLNAMNPSNHDVLQKLAINIGLDGSVFLETLKNHNTEAKFSEQLDFVRQLPVNGFPSLVLSINGHNMPVVLDYIDEQKSLADLLDKLKSYGLN